MRKNMKKSVLATTMALATVCSTIQPFEVQPGYVKSVEAATQATTVADLTKISIKTTDGNGLTIKKADGYQKKATLSIGKTSYAKTKIKVKGDFSDNVTKKSYTIKLDKKQDLLGDKQSAKKWYLLADTFDPTLLREQIALDLAQSIGFEKGAALDYQRVQLEVDGTDVGCYLLVEAADGTSNRADTSWNKDEFVVEYKEDAAEDDAYIDTETFKYRYSLTDPDEFIKDDTEKKYIKNTMDKIEAVIATGDINEIATVVNLDSFAKAYVINEIMKPANIQTENCYYYYKDDQLYAGLLHGFQFSAGNVGSSVANNENGEIASPEGLYAAQNLYGELMKVDAFAQMVRYQYQKLIADGTLNDIYKNDGSIDKNSFVGTSIATASFSAIATDSGNYACDAKDTYEGNVKELKTWLQDRVAYLSKQWGTEGELDYSKYYVELAGFDKSKYKDITSVKELLAKDVYADDITKDKLKEMTSELKAAIKALEKYDKLVVAEASFEGQDSLDKAKVEKQTGVYVITSAGITTPSTMRIVTNSENGTDLELSTTDYLLSDETTSAKVPVMKASAEKTWTKNQVYIQICTSTKGMKQLAFSGEIGALDKTSPAYYALSYSLDGQNWTDVETSVKELEDIEEMKELFKKVTLPTECNDQGTLYLRVSVAKNETIAGDTFFGTESGEIAINNFKLTGRKIVGEEDVTPEDPNQGDTKPEDTKPEDPNQGDTKPEDTKLEDPNKDDVTPGDSTPDTNHEAETPVIATPATTIPVTNGSVTTSVAVTGGAVATSDAVTDGNTEDPEKTPAGLPTPVPTNGNGTATPAPNTPVASNTPGVTQTPVAAQNTAGNTATDTKLSVKASYGQSVKGKGIKKVTVTDPKNITLYTKTITVAQLSVVTETTGTVSYKSSNTKVAKVSENGKITAVAQGTTEIKVTADGKETTITVTVKKPSFSVAKKSITVKKGKKYKVSSSATPQGKITYKIANKRVASVNASGVVLGKKKGNTKLTLTCNGIKISCKVKVR